MIEDLYYKKNINCSYTLIIIYVKNKIKKFRKMHTKKGALCSNSIDVRSLLVKRVRWRNLTDVYHQTGYLNEKLREFPFLSIQLSFVYVFYILLWTDIWTNYDTVHDLSCWWKIFCLFQLRKMTFSGFFVNFFLPVVHVFCFSLFFSILVFVSTFLFILTHKQKN